MLAAGGEARSIVRPTEQAWKLVKKYFTSENFKRIPGTCAYRMTLEFARSLTAHLTFRVGMSVPGHSFDDVDFMEHNGRYYVPSSQMASPERELILRLKAYFHEHYSSRVCQYDTSERYKNLPEYEQRCILRDYQGEHAFVGKCLFILPRWFECVAKMCRFDPFAIAAHYGVPETYVMVEMSSLASYRAHFMLGSNGDVSEIRGPKNNVDLLESQIAQPGNDLLARHLWHVPLEHHDRWIYKFSELGKEQFLCMGKVLEKRTQKRSYVFGMPRDSVNESLLHYLKSDGLLLKSVLS